MNHEGTIPIVTEYVERISAFGRVSQQLGNNLRFLQKYQLYQISTLPKFTLQQVFGLLYYTHYASECSIQGWKLDEVPNVYVCQPVLQGVLLTN